MSVGCSEGLKSGWNSLISPQEATGASLRMDYELQRIWKEKPDPSQGSRELAINTPMDKERVPDLLGDPPQLQASAPSTRPHQAEVRDP